MNDVRGAVNVILYGPADRFDNTLATLQAAGITAQRDEFEPRAISAFFSDGSDRPSPEFIERCEARVRQIAEETGFTVNRVGVWATSAATRQLPYNRHTDEWLGEFVDSEAPLSLREEQLQRLAERQGIPVNDIELRDPDYLSPPAG
ncbi:hypothetical protein [Streptomyces violens]|uniref:hypothetical protein n=1 Tax=Streptomyces violens TaxID=66377 RepID=UPI0004C12212|nr:hypothetical protein [Streptomyces violens]